MRFDEFLKVAGAQPVIDTGMLLAGKADSRPVKVQISRWLKSGKLLQLKRGYYLLAEPYRKTSVYEPFIASVLKRPSYLSLEKALEFHGLIPDAVSTYTSVTTRRPARFISEAGVFEYRHIKQSLFWGYHSVCVNKQVAFIAAPEKALLDFFYLNRVPASFDYIDEMRLQNLEKVNRDTLREFAKRFDKPGMKRIGGFIEHYIISRLESEKEI